MPPAARGFAVSAHAKRPVRIDVVEDPYGNASEIPAADEDPHLRPDTPIICDVIAHATASAELKISFAALRNPSARRGEHGCLVDVVEETGAKNPIRRRSSAYGNLEVETYGLVAE